MRRGARRFVVGTAGLGLVVGSVVWGLPLAWAEPECLTSSSDFDRDGTPDVAVGAPGAAGHNGAVYVRLSNEGDPLTATLTGPPGFGSAVTSLSSYTTEGDDALCSQLVVGSPDESLRTDKQRTGIVYVFFWDAGSSQFVRRSTFHPQSQGVGGADQSGARFGAALAAEQRPADSVDPRPVRLYVGSPGFDVDGVRDAGRVTSFTIDNAPEPLAHETQTIDYGDDFTPGRPSTDAALGTSLSVAGGVVAAGAPGQTAHGVPGAGTVLVASTNRGPDDFLPKELSQATKGVLGAAEQGDRFGASVHLVADPGVSPPTLLVGAPGEDQARTADTGAVTIAQISETTGKPLGTSRAVDQDSAKMAGTAEAGDAFGSTVSSMTQDTRTLFLVGSPGEDVGSVRDAGMVQTVGTGVGWTGNSAGLPGTAQAGGRMGASLGGSPATGALRPLIGVPGEKAAAGAVIVGLPVDGTSVDYLAGARAGDRYGFTVGP